MSFPAANNKLFFVFHPRQRRESPQIRGENLFDLGGEECVSRGSDRPVQSQFEQKGEGAGEAEGEGEGEGKREREGERKSGSITKWYVVFFFLLTF